MYPLWTIFKVLRPLFDFLNKNLFSDPLCGGTCAKGVVTVWTFWTAFSVPENPQKSLSPPEVTYLVGEVAAHALKAWWPFDLFWRPFSFPDTRMNLVDKGRLVAFLRTKTATLDDPPYCKEFCWARFCLLIVLIYFCVDVHLKGKDIVLQ